jgi:hypothetical protein
MASGGEYDLYVLYQHELAARTAALSAFDGDVTKRLDMSRSRHDQVLAISDCQRRLERLPHST